MIKIKSIKFPQEHPILGNLELNFCDNNGNPADTIIIAGENGTGKTTVLEEIYNLFNSRTKYKDLESEVLIDDTLYILKYKGNSVYQHTSMSKSIYATVNINFSSNKVKGITASNVDNENINNNKFGEKTALDIKQLLVDITNDDNRIKAEDYDRVSKGEQKGINKSLPLKTGRFKEAFNFMFDNIKYKGIESKNENIEILFEKNGKEISIDDLSSGEKQIVFRGAFLLRDKEALNGAVVLIDEPEISMHPEWQKKIMDFYKKIFQNQNGEQTSQIIVTTHSPFIIHNENRYNDKVIVLKHDKNGGVVVSDKPEYYQANTVQAVEDAFNIPNFLSNTNENIVFVEGKTDEQYFNKAVEVFEINNLPFKFKSIGENKKSGGSSKLDTAYQVAQYMQLSHKYVFLYDCDKKKENQNNKNLYIYGLEQKLGDFNRGIEKGIENLLILNHEQLNELEIFKNFEKYYAYTDIDKGFGKKQSVVTDMHKTQLCEDICSLDNEQLKIILSNLKTEIEKLRTIFEQ